MAKVTVSTAKMVEDVANYLRVQKGIDYTIRVPCRDDISQAVDPDPIWWQFEHNLCGVKTNVRRSEKAKYGNLMELVEAMTECPNCQFQAKRIDPLWAH